MDKKVRDLEVLKIINKATLEMLLRIIFLNDLKTDEASKLVIEHTKALSAFAELRNSYTNNTNIVR